jgi:hypothetical protein
MYIAVVWRLSPHKIFWTVDKLILPFPLAAGRAACLNGVLLRGAILARHLGREVTGRPMIEREYEYRLKAGRVQTRALLYGAFGLFMAYMAVTNDRGLELFVIPLSKSSATIAYWVFAGLAALFCAIDLVNVERRAALRQRVALAKDGLIVPKSLWSEEEIQIPYQSIRDLKSFNEPDSLVVVRHQGGEFTLRLDMLPDERAYSELVETLAALVAIAKGREDNSPPAATMPQGDGTSNPPPAPDAR